MTAVTAGVSPLVRSARQKIADGKHVIATARLVLNALDAQPKALAEVVAETGCPRSSVSRHLNAWVDVGCAVRTPLGWVAAWAVDDGSEVAS
jgi:hypothetical protein